jgi:hypothetical protein
VGNTVKITKLPPFEDDEALTLFERIIIDFTHPLDALENILQNRSPLGNLYEALAGKTYFTNEKLSEEQKKESLERVVKNSAEGLLSLATEGVGETSIWSSEKGIYSVGYEVKLPKDMYPGVSSPRHFQEANKQLYEAFQKDSKFAQQIEELYPGIIDGVQPGKRGAFSRKPPTNDVTWHHHPEREGVMQLIPFEQHTAEGKIQSILHPNRKGGMENWGGGR